jgi:hypothetical protein
MYHTVSARSALLAIIILRGKDGSTLQFEETVAFDSLVFIRILKVSY